MFDESKLEIFGITSLSTPGNDTLKIIDYKKIK